MKTLLHISLLGLLVLSSCDRRELTEKRGDQLAMIPIAIDWSKSNLNIDDISRVTVRVFPHDGSPAYNFVMQENKTSDVIPLAVGKYSFVIFNETTDSEDWNSIVFKDIDHYNSFSVTTADDAFRGLYTKAEGDIIRKSPDELAVFSIDEFEVTPQMVNYTRSKSKVVDDSIEKQMAQLTSIAPLSVIKHVKVIVRIDNLTSAKKASGAISGVVGVMQMSTRKPTTEAITHVFILNGRKYDSPEAPKNGSIGATVAIFDPMNFENLKASLMLDFLLFDDTTLPTEVFDITNQLKTDSNDISISIGRQQDGKIDGRPIVLPAIPIAGENIGVDNWDEVVVPIN